MAATKLSALTALLGTEAAAGDLVYMADTSANASKKLAMAQRAGPFLLDEITIVSGAEFDFLDIPQQFNRIFVRGELRGSAAAVAVVGYCYFNNDRTVTNYFYQQLVGSNGAVSAGEGAIPTAFTVPGSTGVANGYGGVYVALENYAGSNLKIAKWQSDAYRNGGAESSTYLGGGFHDTMVSPITRLTITTANYPTSWFSGTLRLYGEY